MTAPPPQLACVARRVETRLGVILEAERRRWCELDAALDEPLGDLADLVLAGGKRIRPAYCHWGWVLAGGEPDGEQAIDPGCALELLHAFALAHDDVMDASPTRRGHPTIWRRFGERHRRRGWRGEERRFAEAAAVLAGDIAMVLADRTLGRVDPAVRQVWDTLRTELNMGQYLDVVGTARGGVSAAEARLIVRHKTAGYTIVRPLQLGAALAGRADLADDIAAHAMPLGTAYQLRDDVLGAFGDPLVTGKPVGEDLREAKPTVLMARARAAATAAQREVLARVGDHATETDITDIQQVIVDTGALEATEAEITDLMSQAVTAIDLLPPVPEARRALVALAEFAVAREA